MEFIRRVPTDADSGRDAVFSDDGRLWTPGVLSAVASGELPFVNEVGIRWRLCRIKTDIPIPDGYFQATAEEAAKSDGARRWVAVRRYWASMDDLKFAADQKFFIVPIKEESAPVEKKYRPFASMEEWWPHRDRWYRDARGVVKGWYGVGTASLDFNAGAKFLNDDGTDCEPFGVEVTE